MHFSRRLFGLVEIGFERASGLPVLTPTACQLVDSLAVVQHTYDLTVDHLDDAVAVAARAQGVGDHDAGVALFGDRADGRSF